MTTLQDLIAQRESLERQIEEIRKNARNDALAQTRQLMTEYGLTPADVVSPRTSNAARKERAKVLPKYRSPETGETWSGRGLNPNWLKSALNEGKTLEDFAI